MHTWQHFVHDFTWIVRHQIMNLVVLSWVKAVGAPQLFRTNHKVICAYVRPFLALKDIMKKVTFYCVR